MAEIGGYEWGVTCDCGQKIGLAGMSDHPIMDVDYSEYEILQEARIRSIEGMREFECPNCGDTIRMGVEVGRSDERIGDLVDAICNQLDPIEKATKSGELPDPIKRTLSSNLDLIKHNLAEIKEEA